MKENQILASLNHRNIVRCYEITRSREGLPTIVMEYVRVSTSAPSREPFPELSPHGPGRDGAYLKERNILHRDLSPNNILVTLQDDRRLVKILDFGSRRSCRRGRRGADADGRVPREARLRLARAPHVRPRRLPERHLLARRHLLPPPDEAPAHQRPELEELPRVGDGPGEPPADRLLGPRGEPPDPGVAPGARPEDARQAVRRPAAGVRGVIDAIVAAQGEAERAGSSRPRRSPRSPPRRPRSRSRVRRDAGGPARPAPPGSPWAGPRRTRRGCVPFTRGRDEGPLFRLEASARTRGPR